MKGLATVFFALFLSFAWAQKEADLEYYQDLFGMNKVQVVTNLIELGENQEEFWNIYDDYENERRELGLHRYGMVRNYVDQYEDLNNENVDEVLKASMKRRERRDELIKKYYKRLSKEFNPVIAAQFYQIEHYFQSEINVAIFSSLPMVGEIKH